MIAFVKLLISIAWFLITIGVLFNIWKKSSLETAPKILWTLGILFFPFLGPVAWILFGDRTA
ncbi:MAG: hypothetical protein D6722_15230 [Bacteroidetes bacterium]|nr:MAG: hypothetical protein D6722_15230 [Bacteroidota bacterium]